MAANPIREKRKLMQILAQPNPSVLGISSAVQGQVLVESLDRSVSVLVTPPSPDDLRIYNLIAYAPISVWRNSVSLLRGVEQGFLFVTNELPDAGPDPLPTPTDECCGVVAPVGLTTGDILTWSGTEWIVINAETAGKVLMSNGIATIPSYQIQTNGGERLLLTDQTITGNPGDAVFLSGLNTWNSAQSDDTLAKANCKGIAVDSTTVCIVGLVNEVNFTTDGGQPTIGQKVYLAKASADTSTGIGKLTATVPTTNFLVEVGICTSNAAYAADKTAGVLFQPSLLFEF
jgi:hypothetical protein